MCLLDRRRLLRSSPRRAAVSSPRSPSRNSPRSFPSSRTRYRLLRLLRYRRPQPPRQPLPAGSRSTISRTRKAPPCPIPSVPASLPPQAIPSRMPRPARIPDLLRPTEPSPAFSEPPLPVPGRGRAKQALPSPPRAGGGQLFSHPIPPSFGKAGGPPLFRRGKRRGVPPGRHSCQGRGKIPEPRNRPEATVPFARPDGTLPRSPRSKRDPMRRQGRGPASSPPPCPQERSSPPREGRSRGVRPAGGRASRSGSRIPGTGGKRSQDPVRIRDGEPGIAPASLRLFPHSLPKGRGVLFGGTLPRGTVSWFLRTGKTGRGLPHRQAVRPPPSSPSCPGGEPLLQASP